MAVRLTYSEIATEQLICACVGTDYQEPPNFLWFGYHAQPADQNGDGDNRDSFDWGTWIKGGDGHGDGYKLFLDGW